MSEKKAPSKEQLRSRSDRSAKKVLNRTLVSETPSSFRLREGITRNAADVLTMIAEMYMDEIGPQNSHIGLTSALSDVVEMGIFEYDRRSPTDASALIFWSIVCDLAERLAPRQNPANQFAFATVVYRGPDTINRIANCLKAMMPPKMSNEIGMGLSDACFEENKRLKEILTGILYKNPRGEICNSYEEGADLRNFFPDLDLIVKDE